MISVGVANAYTVFSYIYFVCGGTNCDGGDEIYPVLNWNKASRTWIFCAGMAIYVGVIHVVTYILCRLRICLHARFGRTSSSHVEFDEKTTEYHSIDRRREEMTSIEINCNK